MIGGIFGSIKMICSITIFSFNIKLAFNSYERILQSDSASILGSIIAFLLLLFYSIYLFYSGWTELANIGFKRRVLWIGLMIGILIAIVLFLLKGWIYMIFGAFVLILSLQEISRLRKNIAKD